jgi:hypothetical protein
MIIVDQVMYTAMCSAFLRAHIQLRGFEAQSYSCSNLNDSLAMLDNQRHAGINRALFNDEMPVTTESFAYVPGAIAGSRVSMCLLGWDYITEVKIHW